MMIEARDDLTIHEPPTPVAVAAPTPPKDDDDEQQSQDQEEVEVMVPKLASLQITTTQSSSSSSSSSSSTSKVLWSTIPGLNFISGTSLTSLSITPQGSMSETSYQRIYNIQTIDNVVVHDNEVITIVGQLSHCIEDDGSLPSDSPGYTLSFEKCSGSGKEGITFSLKVEGGEVVYKKESSSSNYNCRDDGRGRRRSSAAVAVRTYHAIV